MPGQICPKMVDAAEPYACMGVRTKLCLILMFKVVNGLVVVTSIDLGLLESDDLNALTTKVPEPGSLTLFLTGGVLGFFVRSRRRQGYAQFPKDGMGIARQRMLVRIACRFTREVQPDNNVGR